MKILKFIGRVFIFCFLTVISQIGGIIYLINLTTYKFVNTRISSKTKRVLIKFSTFLFLYLFITFTIIPFLAKPFGRVPLPVITVNYLHPLNIMTCVLNRHYVTPELLDLSYTVATKMSRKYSGIKINYLDAGFPFINKFPLLPHLSHNNGKKIDFAFCYNNSKTSLPTNNSPSFIGYGVCEGPKPGEINTSAECEQEGFWQYNILQKIVPQWNKKNYTFNELRTKDLINFFANEPLTSKIYIEPHLKTRLELTSPKIRFHGCKAVRHDDHIHVQID